MIFWFVTGGITLVVVAVLSLALMRGRRDERAPAAYDLEVYRDQLKEVDRDLARGVITETDAERIRTEVSRRILAADAALQRDQGGNTRRGGPFLAGLMAAGIVAGSFALYLQIGAPGYGDLALADRLEQAEILRTERPSQADAEASLPAAPPPVDVDPDYVALVDQLREAVASRPNDLEGYRLLTQAEARLANFGAAHAAKSRVIELLGDNVTALDFSEYGDLLVLAAGGYVSLEAEAALAQALNLDPTNGTARYYMGLMLVQTGRPDQALRVWDQLLREGPEDAPWIAPIDLQIEDIAARAGVRYQKPQIGSARGPSAADIEAAEELSPAERMQMIQGMVAGLGERLASEGGPPEDWAQLISALGVLGRLDDARAIFEEARTSFAADPTAMDMLNRAAERVGLQ